MMAVIHFQPINIIADNALRIFNLINITRDHGKIVKYSGIARTNTVHIQLFEEAVILGLVREDK